MTGVAWVDLVCLGGHGDPFGGGLEESSLVLRAGHFPSSVVSSLQGTSWRTTLLLRRAVVHVMNDPFCLRQSAPEPGRGCALDEPTQAGRRPGTVTDEDSIT